MRPPRQNLWVTHEADWAPMHSQCGFDAPIVAPETELGLRHAGPPGNGQAARQVGWTSTLRGRPPDRDRGLHAVGWASQPARPMPSRGPQIDPQILRKSRNE